MPTSPTSQTYDSLTAAYDYFNGGLFDGELPPCLITMQRHKGAYGYFSSERFASADNPADITDEIALNPAHFAARSPAEVLSTLAHEMAHLWQHHFGAPSRTSYHNKEWAAKMRMIGLIPTDTGEPGGKDTGQRVTHIIEEGGPFARVCSAFLATSNAVLYQDRADDAGSTIRKRKAASKTKYTCQTCGLNAWAKPDAPLVCGDCEAPMECEPEEDDAVPPVKAAQGNAQIPIGQSRRRSKTLAL